jgi:hypothetical protein
VTAAAVSEPVPLVAPAAEAAVAPSALLRTALVWRGEVMADRVSRVAEPITLGASARSTFVVPDLALPPDFAIIRPGNRGYLLTLSARMRGTICVDGHEREVADFVRRGGEGGVGDVAAGDGDARTFRATSIGGRDWGVIDLDPDGAHQLFFQFVAPDAPLAKRRHQLELLLPALAFSLLLHTVLLAVSYRFDDEVDPLAYPGSAALTGRFLIRREQEPPPPEPQKAERAVAAANAATAGRSGRSGGKGEGPRARDHINPPPPAKDCWQQVFNGCVSSRGDADACAAEAERRCNAPKLALLDDKNRSEIETVRDLDLGDALDRFARLPGARRAGGAGQGKGTGTGFGDDEDGTGTTRGGTGDGPGGGGALDGDRLSRGKIDPGATRPSSGRGGGNGLKEAALVATGSASGDFGGLTKEEIDRVVRSRQGLIRSCYQRELDHTAGLGGKLVVNFTIAPAGEVTQSKIDGGKSTLRNAAVEDCVNRQIGKLRFPPKGGGFVNYPFIFSQGG